MPKRSTETLFLRVDPEVARLVRQASELWQVAVSHIAETALRRYLVEVTTEEERKNLLSTVEEALVNRLDGRMAKVLRRISDLYAKEAFDHAEALVLMKAIVSLVASDERTTERVLAHARKEATERLRNRVGPEAADAHALSRAQIEQLQRELTKVRDEASANLGRASRAERRETELQNEIAELRRQNQSLERTLNQERRLHEDELARDAWAAQQLETQGFIRRKSFKEWQEEYVKQNPFGR